MPRPNELTERVPASESDESMHNKKAAIRVIPGPGPRPGPWPGAQARVRVFDEHGFRETAVFLHKRLFVDHVLRVFLTGRLASG